MNADAFCPNGWCSVCGRSERILDSHRSAANWLMVPPVWRWERHNDALLWGWIWHIFQCLVLSQPCRAGVPHSLCFWCLQREGDILLQRWFLNYYASFRIPASHCAYLLVTQDSSETPFFSRWWVDFIVHYYSWHFYSEKSTAFQKLTILKKNPLILLKLIKQTPSIILSPFHMDINLHCIVFQH